MTKVVDVVLFLLLLLCARSVGRRAQDLGFRHSPKYPSGLGFTGWRLDVRLDCLQVQGLDSLLSYSI
jgi:hypothetical protein